MVVAVAVVSMAFATTPGTIGTTSVGAASFDPNFLISDAMFDATGTMTTADIQAFLNRYPNSCLRNYRAPKPLDFSVYGADASAAEIIRSAALLYGVNPQVLLVTLEKEQTLVTGGAGCADWRYWSAMGYACPDGGSRYDYPALGITGTCVSAQQHAGFSAQVNHGAWQLQFNRQRAIGNLNWRDNQTVPNYGYYTKGYRQQYVGAPSIYYDGTATISGRLITMTNGPTATLYTYTPHVSANQAFVTLFTNWFGSPTGTPNGTTTTTSTVAPTTAPPTTAPPISHDEYRNFVDGASRILLGRPATTNEKNLWAQHLSTDGRPVNVLRAMAATAEHDENVVANSYVRLLGRTPDPGGAATWLRRLTETGRNDTVLVGLAGSTEYYRRCASDPGLFVQCLYHDLLGRPADLGGYVNWVGRLRDGQTSRGGVAKGFVNSSEYAEYFVDQSYRQILGRRADASGLVTWKNLYRLTGSETLVRIELMRSSEGVRRLSGGG